jgi:hypothetical protein
MSTLPTFVAVTLCLTAKRSSVTGLVTKLLCTTEKAGCQLDKRQAGARNKHCNFFPEKGELINRCNKLPRLQTDR